MGGDEPLDDMYSLLEHAGLPASKLHSLAALAPHRAALEAATPALLSFIDTQRRTTLRTANGKKESMPSPVAGQVLASMLMAAGASLKGENYDVASRALEAAVNDPWAREERAAGNYRSARQEAMQAFARVVQAYTPGTPTPLRTETLADKVEQVIAGSGKSGPTLH